MHTYPENKKVLTSLREKYTSAGDLVFRAAVGCLFHTGSENIHQYRINSERMYAALEKEGIKPKDAELNLAVFRCAEEMKDLNVSNLMTYMYTENLCFLGIADRMAPGSPMPYDKMSGILAYVLEDLAESYADSADLLELLRNAGANDKEIIELGYEYLLDLEEEPDDDEI